MPLAPSIDKNKDTEPPISLLLGLPFHELSMEEALNDCHLALDSSNPKYFVTANVDFIAQSYQNPQLRKILFHAQRVLCDGMPLVWVSKLLGGRIQERVAGADLVPKLMQLCAQTGKNVYFLGSDHTSLAKAKDILENRYPSLKIVGTHSPPMSSLESWENEWIANDIRSKKTDLLLVALGCPKQELWIAQFHQKAAARLSIGVGSSIDFIAGKQIRAPRALQFIGLEWLWRLLMSPLRLMKRYVRDLLYLLWITFKQYRSMYLVSLKQVPISIYTHKNYNQPSDQKTSVEIKELKILKWKGRVERANIENFFDSIYFNAPIILDLSSVNFIDSSGLGLLAKIARKAKIQKTPFYLLAPSKIVMSALKSVRLESEIPYFFTEESIAEDLHHFQKKRNSPTVSIL